MKLYTDIEQSKNLLNLGLKPESSDMCYIKHCTSNNPEWRFDEEVPPMVLGDTPLSKISVPTLPCWSLAALLELLPNEISTNDSFACHYQIDIRKYDGGDNTTLYQIAYGNNRGRSGSWHDMINTGEKENLIDCCVQMILKLHELKMLRL